MTSMDSCSLAGVPLTPQQLTALARAGVVSEERHGGGIRYRLRFRVEGRQVAINLGSDPQRAETVRQAVAALQAPRRAEREFQDSVDAARKSRRRVKQILYNSIHELGLKWHGLMIRRPRTAAAPHFREV